MRRRSGPRAILVEHGPSIRSGRRPVNSRPPKHGAVHGARRVRHDRAMQHGGSASWQQESGLAGGFRARDCRPWITGSPATESHLNPTLSHLISPYPGESRRIPYKNFLVVPVGRRKPAEVLEKFPNPSVFAQYGNTLGSRPTIPQGRRRWTSRRCARQARVI